MRQGAARQTSPFDARPRSTRLESTDDRSARAAFRVASHASRRFPGPRPGVRQRQHACAGSSRTGPACCTAWTPTPTPTAT